MKLSTERSKKKKTFSCSRKFLYVFWSFHIFVPRTEKIKGNRENSIICQKFYVLSILAIIYCCNLWNFIIPIPSAEYLSYMHVRKVIWMENLSET